MPETVVEELDEDNSDDWTTVYNSVMRRGLRFTPISSNMLQKITGSMKPYKIKYLVAYENGTPSSICSYSQKDPDVFRIVDFCVLPHGENSGTHLVDIMLTEARIHGYNTISCWLPLSVPKSIDVLAEYLFIPDDSRVLMRHFLTEPPKGLNLEISEYSEPDSEPSILPFETGFQMYSLMESLKASWYHAATIVSAKSQSSGIEIYLSTKLNRQGWIFPTCETKVPLDANILSTALSYLHDSGVRDVLTESEGAMQWQKSFREHGFKEVSTQFELNFALMH